MAVDVNRTLGELVAEQPARARVLERAGIDYCCHGDRSLSLAAAEAGLDANTLALVLDAVEAVPAAADGAERLQPAALAHHIVETHHRYLAAELPELDTLAVKVRGVHGERHPELAEVARLFHQLRGELEPHLAAEEAEVFPAIEAGTDHEAIDAGVARLVAEHARAGELLAALRAAARDYAVPADACASYRSLYERLAALEADTFRHIHLENNVLFRAARGAWVA